MIEKENIVAVYGTLKKWFWNHRTMEWAQWEFIRVDYIPFTELASCWYPMMKFDDASSKKFIEVELYKVDDRGVLDYLDRLEGYPSLYIRKKVTTLLWEESVVVYQINSDIRDTSDNYKIETPTEVTEEWEYFSWK